MCTAAMKASLLVALVGLIARALPLEPTSVYTQQPLHLDIADPYPDKQRITFRPDRTFKLMVFSDIHFGENPWDEWGPQQDVNTIRLMRTMLAAEKPDYVVINGDLITGENTFRENVTSLIDMIVGPLNDAQIPFSCAHGNHDNEINITHSEEITRERLVAPLSYTRPSPPGIGGDGGEGNYWVPIYREDTDKAPAIILWFFDSRGGHLAGVDRKPVPDWVDASVAEWIRTETAAMDAAWGPGDDRSAMAFVHIPPHAIQAVQASLDSARHPGLNAEPLIVGDTQATQDPSSMGNDEPFWDSLNKYVAHLRVVVSGHDHGDEWCAREPTRNVIFCFDKHSGYGGYTGPGWGRGVRTFKFSSADPHDGLETYIKYENGTTSAQVVLNDAY